ncbi:MAG: S1C family serine protease [Gemmatimonadaceae bacterium]|nr:S1C family serine protease [Gemmatimonadaceae bacterium]
MAAALTLSTAGAAQARRPSVAPVRTVRDIAAKAVPASVTVIALGADGDTIGIGSGFVIRADGVVITNHHVLAGASQARLIRANGEVLDRVTVIDVDSLTDLAVLKATAIDLPTLTLSSTAPSVGDRVVVIGAPLGLEHTVSDGIVSAVRVEGGRERIQMSAPISPGSSGGPVIDDQARVIGITRATVRAGQALNFAIPAKYALALLAETRSAPPRSVAEVFSGSGAGEAVKRPAAPAPADAPTRAPFRAPAPGTPRKNALVGTFKTLTEATNPNAAPDTLVTGLLVLPETGVGFWRPRYVNDYVMLVSDAVATGSGRVGVKAGRIPLEGWVTDSGFYIAGEDPRERLTLRIIATPIDLPLSYTQGIYDIAVRTSYTAGSFTGTPTSWSGTAAIMTTADSIFADVSLTNTVGGSTGAFIMAPIGPTGAFKWEDRTKAVNGYVRNGKIEFDWIDRRENNAVYRGIVSGQRR